MRNVMIVQKTKGQPTFWSGYVLAQAEAKSKIKG
jgi:hypothetical protein